MIFSWSHCQDFSNQLGQVRADRTFVCALASKPSPEIKWYKIPRPLNSNIGVPSHGCAYKWDSKQSTSVPAHKVSDGTDSSVYRFATKLVSHESKKECTDRHTDEVNLHVERTQLNTCQSIFIYHKPKVMDCVYVSGSPTLREMKTIGI